jgi:hypothetical protein
MRRISILLLAFLTCFVSPAWPQHKIITFRRPPAGTGSGQATIAFGINEWGAIIGCYIDGSKCESRLPCVLLTAEPWDSQWKPIREV